MAKGKISGTVDVRSRAVLHSYIVFKETSPACPNDKVAIMLLGRVIGRAFFFLVD